MLAIATLTFLEAEAIERRARAEFRHTCNRIPDFGCMACRVSGADDRGRPPVTADWLLLHAATGRSMPAVWAPEVFRALGDDTPYGALVRGYLLLRGLDCLLFDAPEDPNDP